MNAYLPGQAMMWVYVSGLLGAIVLVGYAITRWRSAEIARLAAWLLVLAGVLLMNGLTDAEPGGFRMVAIILALLYAMKALVTVESQRGGGPRLPFVTWCGFTLLWFGMRPALFTNVPAAALRGAGSLMRSGLTRLALGLFLVIAARLSWTLLPRWWDDDPRRCVATVLLLPGLSLMLHFGIFRIVAGAWRLVGAKCQPLFRAPLLSRSLTEFWGKRWNLAFSEMTTLAVYRPSRAKFGTRGATWLAFLFSGLLHELAISVPVQAGYGLPLLYFAMHGVGMMAESHWRRQAWLQSAWTARLWTGLWILLPLPLLFHAPFLNGCLWPLIGIQLAPAGS